jgi:hypothetical protein
MPDPNPADAEVNKPNLPLDFTVDLVSHNEIHCGWMWAIDRIGRIPSGTHGYVVEYEQVKEYLKEHSGKEALKHLFSLLDTHPPMFGPQPAFRATHVSKIPELGVDIIHKELEPDTEYVLVFSSFNAAGRSHFFGTFEYSTGIITPVRTKEAPSV